MSPQKIRECEYCGRQPTVSINTARMKERAYFTVCCVYCGSHGPWLTMEADAIEAWNKQTYQYADLVSWDHLPDVTIVEKAEEPTE